MVGFVARGVVFYIVGVFRPLNEGVALVVGAFAVAVSNSTVVRTRFINKVQELDKCRKGRFILKRKKCVR